MNREGQRPEWNIVIRRKSDWAQGHEPSSIRSLHPSRLLNARYVSFHLDLIESNDGQDRFVYEILVEDPVGRTESVE